ncbi:ribonuclease D [Calycomorphotria hydatis]|uniref:Ribonuclease D n=1 Tax=Calycomorphotria hydatis TaxID=2528027 RepID=A0A517T3Q0_9PLAN|nr:HRDC domain-containing protein [Calycomorphotria hydatis]QDT62971.1 Ribonuclease D [Calycomorphotria hydatis]
MSSRLITKQAKFEQLCDHIRKAGLVAFDTEFVSEYTFRPELCLLQFATKERVEGVDPFEVTDLTPWWELMTDDKTTVVVHGGQAEVRFCIDLFGSPPCNMSDVQLTEGLLSRSYPLGYESLVSRVLGKKLGGSETRADWRRRPLTSRQIDYALDDVTHVLPIWEKQKKLLRKRGRKDWAETEINRMIDDINVDLNRAPWQRVSGLHRLKRRDFAVAVKIAEWREGEAIERNRPPRRILRDDLVVDISRRQPGTLKELESTRDFNRMEAKRSSAGLLDAILAGQEMPEEDIPTPPEADRPDKSPDEHMLGQLLGIALSSRCAEMEVSRQLVGTSADLRHLVRWHLYGEQNGTVPRLASGWRAEVCGDLLTDLMDGKISLRVADPNSDHPLVFERDGEEAE